jgi:alkylation response protein AidB-like acyl-CoA dehydrogenase
VNLVLDEDHEAFRSSVRAFVAAKSTPDDVRRRLDEPTAFDETTWRQMSDQLGLQSLAIPEAFGGGGAGMLEVVIVMAELGRGLLATPYLSSAVLAPAVLLESPDDPTAASLLPRLATGEVLVAVSASDDTTLSARLDGTAWMLSGHIDELIDAADADVLLVPARTDGGLRYFQIDVHETGVRRDALVTLDQTRPQASVDLDHAAGTPIGDHTSATRAVQHAADVGAIALAAEQVGGAERCLEMAVEYATVRHQFGRAIGSFQAVKHMCAQMLVDVESARSTVLYAAWVADNDVASLSQAASLAKACASDAFTAVAATNIQVHGGIGFTWEHGAHLYYRRAHSTALLFGDSRWHRHRLAQTLKLG